MYLQKRFLLAAALALLPVDRCSAQFFTPVSTTIDADTGFTNDGTSGQGSEDDEDFGAQTGTLQASAVFDYPFQSFILMGNANGTATIDPASGVIDVNISTTPNGGEGGPNGVVGATAHADATIIFNVPPNSGMYVSLGFLGLGDDAFLSLSGPNGFTTLGFPPIFSFSSVPAGQYTLTGWADTEEVTGFLRGGGISDSIQIIPEPEASALVIAVMGLLPMRRRRG